MMHRLPYAAQQLRTELSEWDERAAFGVDDRDGLGVYRTLVVQTDRLTELSDLMGLVVGVDPRVTGATFADGEARIFFVTGNQSESREPFHIAGVTKVLDTVEEARSHPEETKPRPPRKTAKKAAKKA